MSDIDSPDGRGLDRAMADTRSDVALVDLLDRLLAGGVVLAGDVVISLAGVDLIRVKLNALVTAVAEEMA